MHIQDFFQNFLKLFLVGLHGDCTISLIAPDMSPISNMQCRPQASVYGYIDGRMDRTGISTNKKKNRTGQWNGHR